MSRLWKYARWALPLGALALGLAWSGILPLAASSGHWPVTEWFLHFTMRRTVKARSVTTKVPPLDDPSLVRQGAGHFDTGCRPCHGAPGASRPVALRHMTPRAPSLTERASDWEPEELFWIVKHGVKFSGMPGWPVLERDDEVWSMVAFLEALPALSAEEYRRLAGSEAKEDDPRPLLENLEPSDSRALANCARCHGAGGRGRGRGAVPRLAGQSPDYLYASLRSYAERRRLSGMMQAVAESLSESTTRALARYFADIARADSGEIRRDEQAIARGEAIALAGVRELRIPSCADCHGPKASARKAVYPELAGQYAEYLVLQLELFKSGRRGGTPFAHVMEEVVRRLSPQHMRDVSAYYAALDP